ncbi:FecR domain-containing protein [soil metagenome]
MYYLLQILFSVKEELIIKFINGECSEEELLIVKKWINDPRYKEQFDQIMRSRWEIFSEIDFPETDMGQSVDNILNKIHKEIKPGRNKYFNPLGISKDLKYNFCYYSKFVACLLIFPITYILLFSYYNLYEKEHCKVQVVEIPLINKSTQIGEKRKIKLPDGSYVILNSGSSIDYPEIFADSIRMVNLSGEAFFEVVSDHKKPFRVKTDAALTTALGTAFNIRVRDELAEITLTEGKVRVELAGNDKVFLKPGEMAIANASNQELAVQEVDIKEMIDWKNGVITFKNQQVKEVFLKLENWYGVKINVDKGFKTTEKISGEFNNESLNNILSGLSFLFDFNFKLTGKEVSISKRMKK